MKRKPTRTRLLQVFIAAILFATGIAAPSLADAPPQKFPFSPWGSATLGGSLVADGTVIVALIGGVPFGSTTAVSAPGGDPGWYTLTVPEDDPSTLEKEGGVFGDTVTFTVAGHSADQTATFDTWHNTSPRIDLTATTPDSVKIAWFGAVPVETPGGDPAVQLSWKTALEIDTLGFNLFRTEVNAAAEVQINDELIPSENAGTLTGGIYDFVDNEVTLGTAYEYWIEEVDTSGGATRHGPASVVATMQRLSPSASFSEPNALQGMAATYADPAGWQNIRYADMLVGDPSSASRAICVRYDVQAGKLYLRHPTREQWRGGGTPSAGGAVRNSLAILDYGQSAVTSDGALLEIAWAIRPSGRYSGAQHPIYLRSEDMDGNVDEWAFVGQWAINRTPNYLIPPEIRNTTVMAGTKNTFDPRYRDLDRIANLDQLYFAIVDGVPDGGANPDGVYLMYDQGENMLLLGSTDGSFVGASIAAPGSSAILENELVRVIARWSGPGVQDFRTRIVRWRLEFKEAFVGRHKLYSRAIDVLGPDYGGDTGWRWKGWIAIE